MTNYATGYTLEPWRILDAVMERQWIDNRLVKAKACIAIGNLGCFFTYAAPSIDEEMFIRSIALIAAAPEMLEALKDAHALIADDRLRTRIGKVIVKAEEGGVAA